MGTRRDQDQREHSQDPFHRRLFGFRTAGHRRRNVDCPRADPAGEKLIVSIEDAVVGSI
jgi:hypothetical protein